MPREAIQPNSLGRASLVVGDRWNMLILREAFLGARRYQDWRTALSVSDPVLAARLRDLLADGLLEQHAYCTAPLRHEYRLTDTAKALWQVFVAIWLWDGRWANPPATGRRMRLHHRSCGLATAPRLACSACRAGGVTPQDTFAERHPGHVFADSNPPRRYRRTVQAPAPGDDQHALDALDLLGDRWSTSVLAAAFLGSRRFGDFQRELVTVPPLMLTRRLNTFVDQDVLHRQPVSPEARRLEYRLTAKGLDFFGIFANEIAWSRQWFEDPEGPPLTIVHRTCGRPFDPSYVCNACGEPLLRHEVHFEG